MKRFKKTLFVILVVVMSFVAVQAVWAGKKTCSVVVEGTVSEILVNDNAIVVGDQTVYGIALLWIDINEGDAVVINTFVSLDGKVVACYLTINGELVDLRPAGYSK